MARKIWEHILRFDWLLGGAVFLTCGLGLVSLFSLADASSFPFFYRQLVWVVIGTVLMLMASFVDFRLFRTQSFVVFILYIFAVILLAIVLAGSFAVRGVEAWLKFGSVYFQPAELAKIALIILLAKFFSKRHIEIYRIRHLLVSGLYLALPAGLVLLQPDLGSVIVLVSIWVAIVLFSGMKLKHFFILLFLGGILAISAWNFALAPYQKARISTFINPYADSQGAGYQMIQSMIAVGSGQILGKGLGYGSQSHLNFLPEAETDFIFAAFAEEWGFAGVLAMLSILFLVLWRIIAIGQKASDNFSRLYSLGFAAYIFTQSFIHIGMNIGVMPITGITLPFVSYGGSSLVISLIGVGILQNIKINARKEIE
jgi:rod shape determining protein RodA